MGGAEAGGCSLYGRDPNVWRRAFPLQPRLLPVDPAGYNRAPMLAPTKPCLPTSAPVPPSGPEWLHEIKHDGYRMLALRDGERVRLLSRRGLDWGDRFPTIVAAVEAPAVRTCIIDGELIACDENGLSDFQVLRWRKRDDPAILCAFDLLQIDGRVRAL